MQNLFCTITNNPMLGMEDLIENNSMTLDLAFLIMTFHLLIDRLSRTERIVREDS